MFKNDFRLLSAFWHGNDEYVEQNFAKNQSKYNVESKFEIKMGPFHLKNKVSVVFRYFRKCGHFENILFQLGVVDYSRLLISILIRFWKIRKFQRTGYVNQPVYLNKKYIGTKKNFSIYR
jgi:hypothetical protein